MNLFSELNVERFELGKMEKLLFSHPEGTNDDRFCSLALAVYAAESAQPPTSKPYAKIVWGIH
jgi:hypothetical protein